MTEWPFSYVKHQEMLMGMRRGDWLASADITGAFHLIRMHADDLNDLGFTWPADGRLGEVGAGGAGGAEGMREFLVRVLPFGFGLAPAQFSTISGEIEATVLRRVRAHPLGGSVRMYVYMDDVFVFADSEEACKMALGALVEYCKWLGATLNAAKLRLPAQKGAPLLGLLVDTVGMTVSLPADKRYSTCVLLRVALGTREGEGLPRNFLERLGGRLSYACEVVRVGRSRLLNFWACLRQGGSKSATMEACREDLRWWLERLCSAELVKERIIVTPTTGYGAAGLSVRSDASGTDGAALMLGQGLATWFAWVAATADDERTPSIQMKEVYPLWDLLERYGLLLRGLTLVLRHGQQRQPLWAEQGQYGGRGRGAAPAPHPGPVQAL